MDFKLVTCNRNISNEELLQDLKDVLKKTGLHTITSPHYNKVGKYPRSMFLGRFGGWNQALKKAGIPLTYNRYLTPADLMENLYRVWVTLERQPYISDMFPPLSAYGSSAYKTAFGKWTTALETLVRLIDESKEQDFYVFIRKYNFKGVLKKQDHKTKRKIPRRLRHVIMTRDKYRCQACGAAPATDPSVTLEVDHIVPWAKGGETVAANLQTLCRACNVGKGDLC